MPKNIDNESWLNDFFENSVCGFLIADSQGVIQKGNNKIASWLKVPANELPGKRFTELFTIGGKIYYETHLWPLLRMQGFFDEVVLELKNAQGEKLPVLVNAIETRDINGKAERIHFTILKATDRLLFEKDLALAKSKAETDLLEQTEIVTLREQLIAVLGHDLRNPLSAIMMAVDLMSVDDKQIDYLLPTLKRSIDRISEIVNNIMDFARTRLGDGIVIEKQDIRLEPFIRQVINELNLVYPNKHFITEFDLNGVTSCDPNRISQLLSNLIANAITHGAAQTPVRIAARDTDGILEISVTNNGAPISPELKENIFTPFTREKNQPSQNGLGLGLYISNEIAKAHNGFLSYNSTVEETRFTLRIPLNI
ncbi:MAG: PAS domain-containing sensor histidine kinase [Bacteroidota bacterium]